jgi:hypothetical protein
MGRHTETVQWRGPLALALLAAGYGSAYYLVGSASPDHRKFIDEILRRQLVMIAEGLAT